MNGSGCGLVNHMRMQASPDTSFLQGWISEHTITLRTVEWGWFEACEVYKWGCQIVQVQNPWETAGRAFSTLAPAAAATRGGREFVRVKKEVTCRCSLGSPCNQGISFEFSVWRFVFQNLEQFLKPLWPQGYRECLQLVHRREQWPL